MAYASYEYYRNEFGGTAIPEEVFRRCVNLASRQIDYFTFNRITEADVADLIRDCACEMAEAVYGVRFKGRDADGKVKKSESIDGYSVTWLTEQKDGEDVDTLLRGKLYGICSTYLAHTGLMYRGMDRC